MTQDWKRFELHTTQRGETTCIALLGEFDILGLDQLEAELQRVDDRRGRAVLDLRHLKFGDARDAIDDLLARAIGESVDELLALT
jgi:hypothetical protein